MSHHFDSPEARADSRINLTDNFLFHAPGDRTRLVAAVCVSPLAGLPSPYHGAPQWRTFRPGTAYELRFIRGAGLRADLTYRLVFEGEDAPQRFRVSRVEGVDLDGPSALVGEGVVGTTTALGEHGRAWVSEAGDPFWLDAVAAKQFLDAVLAGGRFRPDDFSRGQVTTAATNVLAIVLELPLAVVSDAPFSFYSAVAALDHGHWHQVARCGRPNFAATFVDDPVRSRRMNETTPEEDRAEFSPDVARVVERVTRAAGTVPDPAGYAARAAAWFLPDVLAFDPALPTGYDFAGLNGRGLRDDFGAVTYSAVFGHPMRTALAPLADLRAEWPWLPPARPLPSGPGVAVPSRSGPSGEAPGTAVG